MICALPREAPRRHPESARERSEYSRSDLSSLLGSSKVQGLLQPLVVTGSGDGYTNVLASPKSHPLAHDLSMSVDDVDGTGPRLPTHVKGRPVLRS